MADVIVTDNEGEPAEVTADAAVVQTVGEHEVKIEQTRDQAATAEAKAEVAQMTADEAAASAAANAGVVAPHEHAGMLTHEHLQTFEEKLDALLAGKEEDNKPPVVEQPADKPPQSRESGAKKKRTFADKFYGRS